jgi:hypothetical protein
MRTIPLTQGYEALVDDEDYAELSRYTWHADVNKNGVYAKRNVPSDRPGGRPTPIRMHQQIMGTHQHGRRVGIAHKNGNGLDNQRANLRVAKLATVQKYRRAANSNSTTGVRNVYPVYKGHGYAARLQYKGHMRNLGTYPTVDQARKASERERARLFGGTG